MSGARKKATKTIGAQATTVPVDDAKPAAGAISHVGDRVASASLGAAPAAPAAAHSEPLTGPAKAAHDAQAAGGGVAEVTAALVEEAKTRLDAGSAEVRARRAATRAVELVRWLQGAGHIAQRAEASTHIERELAAVAEDLA